MIKLKICGVIKEGFWYEGVFIVPNEDALYYRDNEGEWRVINND